MIDLLNTIFLIALTLLSAFLTHYAIQKGKNQANKTDLADLIKIVKEAEHKYVSKIEQLKSKLSVLANKENILFIEEKNSIIEFYSNLNKWIWYGLRFQVDEYNPTSSNELQNTLMQMRDYYFETNVSFGKMQILITDNIILNTGNESIKETLNLHHLIDLTISKLKVNFIEENALNKILFSNDRTLEELSSNMYEYYIKKGE